MHACNKCLEIKRLYGVALQGRWSDLKLIFYYAFVDFDQSCDVCRILGAIWTTFNAERQSRMYIHFQLEPFEDDRKKVILSATLDIITEWEKQEICVSLDPGKMLDSRLVVCGEKKKN